MTLTTTDLRKICDALEHDHERKLFVTQAAFRNAATPSRVRAMLDEIDALTARAEAAEALVKEAAEALKALRTTAVLLQQNAVGCAVNHYGEDFSIHGTPGWLADTAADITRAATFLAKMEKNDER